MKFLLLTIALSGLLSSCKNKDAEEKAMLDEHNQRMKESVEVLDSAERPGPPRRTYDNSLKEIESSNPYATERVREDEPEGDKADTEE